ncbi:MAG: hypothetical protein ACK4ZX_10345, partial [Thermus sp.]
FHCRRRYNRPIYPRFLTPRLLEALQDTPVVFLAGARQMGKSTLVRRLGHGRYLTLDDPLVLASAQRVPFLVVAVPEETWTEGEARRVMAVHLGAGGPKGEVSQEPRQVPHAVPFAVYFNTGEASWMDIGPGDWMGA